MADGRRGQVDGCVSGDTKEEILENAFVEVLTLSRPKVQDLERERKRECGPTSIQRAHTEIYRL
jgi:hypothetical protein